jgi:hypothetical protein
LKTARRNTVPSEAGEARFRFVYDDEQTLWDKVKAIDIDDHGRVIGVF